MISWNLLLFFCFPYKLNRVNGRVPNGRPVYLKGPLQLSVILFIGWTLRSAGTIEKIVHLVGAWKKSACEKLCPTTLFRGRHVLTQQLIF